MVDKEILDDFLSETVELLDEVEPQLVELSRRDDSSCVDAETLNAIFRLFHAMKGGASFLGLTTVTSVTHVAETLLDLIRKGKGGFEPEHGQALCETIGPA
jgi:two-component system, chemotaxis family, sensor kinase CheA